MKEALIAPIAAIVVVLMAFGTMTVTSGFEDNIPGESTDPVDPVDPDTGVIYDGNGGTTTGDATTYVTESTTVMDNMFAYDGHVFLSWNTSKNGSGTEVASGTTVEDGTILYAQWKTLAKLDIKSVQMADFASVNLYLQSGDDESTRTEITEAGTYYLTDTDPVLVMTDKTGADAYALNSHDVAFYYPGTSCSKHIDVQDSHITSMTVSGSSVYRHISYTDTAYPLVLTLTGSSTNVDLLVFNGNGATTSEDKSTVVMNDETSVPANMFNPPAGKEFYKWNTAADGGGTDVEVGSTEFLNGILYARWVS